MKPSCALLLLALFFTTPGCHTSRELAGTQPRSPEFFKVGHRGTRGLMPENTIPAMKKGIAVGANTVEFDIHITKDDKVVVYHDASFDPAYTSMPDGSDIPAGERKKYTFYQMKYDHIRQFIIGKKYYPQFPEQHLTVTYAPLLTEMIDSVEAFTRVQHYPPVYYLLEVKSGPATDGTEQPAPEEYMRILMKALKPKLKQLNGRLLVHSFDIRPLQILHRDYPNIPLGFLTGDKKISFEENMKQLGFIPAFYNPEYHLLTPALLSKCHAQGMKVLPWTVETTGDMQRLKDMGADGIITDYPNRLTDIK